MSESTEILQLGHPALRKTAESVTDFSSEPLQQLVQRMLSLLAESKGVGLAAPQLGYSTSVIVVASKPTSRYPDAPLMQPLVMINPSFQASSENKVKDWEGCLSIPGIRALVPRYTDIQVSYQDSHGKQNHLTLIDFVARIFQHEYDHLQGLVYLDRVENNRDIIAESEFFKLLSNDINNDN
jgi:peptide deformylase